MKCPLILMSAKLWEALVYRAERGCRTHRLHAHIHSDIDIHRTPWKAKKEAKKCAEMERQESGAYGRIAMGTLGCWFRMQCSCIGEGARGLGATACLGWMLWPGCAGMSHPEWVGMNGNHWITLGEGVMGWHHKWLQGLLAIVLSFWQVCLPSAP